MNRLRIIKIGRILIVVDPNLDFTEGGALAVLGGAALMAKINALMATGKYDLIIVTQDWHPAGHYEFASRHGLEPFALIERNGVIQVVYPDHSIQNTAGAKIHPLLDMSQVALILRKGMNIDVASHSAFYSGEDQKGNRYPTGLAGYLSAFDFQAIDFVGLAFDVCVKDSALDAKVEYPDKIISVLYEYCASVNPGNDAETVRELQLAGVNVVGY